MILTRAALVAATLILSPTLALAQWWRDPPKVPHLPEVRIPEIKIPPIKIGGVEVGHKTNKWDIRHNLERDGWWVAYGKEIGYKEYQEFGEAVAASVAAENPAPAMAYLKALVAESVAVLARNAGREFGTKVRDVAERELVSAFYDAVKNGRVRTIKLAGLEVQLGMATYNREETGVPLPNTFQPYMRMRLVIDRGGPGGGPTKYHWVTTIHNPSTVAVNYKFYYGDEWKEHSVAAGGWRWHSHDSTGPPDFRIDFDMGPPARHRRKEYHLNFHRLAIGRTPDASAGEPYTFRFDRTRGWDVYRGKP